MNASDLITIDPEILGGTPVFKGTRVPVKTLFDYLEGRYPLDEFLECFPSVTRDMACLVLERSESALLSPALVRQFFPPVERSTALQPQVPDDYDFRWQPVLDVVERALVAGDGNLLGKRRRLCSPTRFRAE